VALSVAVRANTVVDVITVIAHYRTLPEAADEVRALLAQHARASSAESGCTSA
jgi:quinol monooxygenase YgiN